MSETSRDSSRAVSAIVTPPGLRRGDVVRVVAPSSPFEHVLGWRGMGFLREHFRVRFDRSAFSRAGYLAGDDARRRRELEDALADDECRAIVAMRGGYGASRFVHDVDWTPLRARPRWIVGFSDITALHLEAGRVGVASLHASHVTSLGRGDAVERAAWLDALLEPTRARCFDGLTSVVEGSARGPLFGGNLTLLHASACAGKLSAPPGSVWFLEDVTERPYRIDRMLTTLVLGGHLRDAAAIVFGEFTDCAPLRDGVTVEDVIADWSARLGVPVARGLPSGHGLRNAPLVLGAPAQLHGSRRLTLFGADEGRS